MMTFDTWLGDRVLDEAQLASRRRLWSFLLTKGLTSAEIAVVFDELSEQGRRRW